MREPSRRSLLAGVGTALTALAGCSNTQSSTTSRTETPTETPTTSPTSTVDTTTTASADQLPMTGHPGDVTAFDDALVPFLTQWEIPGATVAVMDGEDLVFTRGYGRMGPDSDEPIQPETRLRIGSLSKPITAVTVLDLVEDGALSLDETAVSLLPDLVPDGGPADSRVTDITVRHLLRHTAGFSRGPVGFDPVFEPKRVAEAMGTDPPASAETTVRFMLDQQLGDEPGSAYQYANVGYCVLGRIIESVTGEAYETHVRNSVLSPLGAGEMRIGPTRQENLPDGEARYLSHATVQSPFPDGGRVPRPYGAGVLSEALDADGGWVGSATHLLRFVRGIDGRDGVPDLLTEDTRAEMLERPDVSHWEGTDQYYGMGWLVDRSSASPLLWHNGSLPGSYAFLAHDRGQETTLVALFNGRAPDQLFGQFNGGAQRTLLRAFDQVDGWPDRDLFGAQS